MKKIVVLLLTISIFISSSVYAFAADQSDVNANFFTDENGNIITYYIDDENIPYQIIDGQKMYIALSLPEYEITDENLLNELKNELVLNTAEEPKGRSVPTSYYDLSGGASTANSISYNISATGLDSNFFHTSIFKFHKSHNAIVIKTSKHRPLFCDQKINIMYYYYYRSTDKWYSYTFMHKDCSIIGGFRFQHLPSAYEYGKVAILASSTMKSCNVEIFTTPYSTGVGTIPTP